MSSSSSLFIVESSSLKTVRSRYFCQPSITHSNPSIPGLVINSFAASNNKNSVKIASEMIEDRYEDLKINTRTLKFEIPKRQHKYLIGPKGATLQEILETTGCILELPPATDPSANVTIHGPQNQLADAIKTVMKKANSMHVQILDITDLHHTENPMKHSINILKYLWNRSKLKNVESKTGVKIVTPKITASAETEMKNLVMEFVSKVPEDVENARKEITEIIKNLPPSYFDVVEINPKFHRHVIGRKGQNLQRVKDAYGVEIIVPDEKEANPEILIVFEGRKGVKEFSDRKKKELYIKEIMEKVKNELLKVERDSSSDFSTQTLVVPVKYHRHIIGPKGINLNAIIHNDNGSGCSSVSVKFGSSKYSGVDDRSSNAQEVSDDSIIVKGPVKEVERIVEEINEKVEDIKRVENMKSFTAEFTIPAIYSSHIIVGVPPKPPRFLHSRPFLQGRTEQFPPNLTPSSQSPISLEKKLQQNLSREKLERDEENDDNDYMNPGQRQEMLDQM
ncbi:6375_t:CDS:2 [Entrophospora sp. SA101]|nr:6375_t:CDS:2 [Entrophospora sp. SA101]